jgi:uncharacterized protein
MKYLLLPVLAVSISCTTHAMKRDAPENNGENNNEHPKKIAKINQLSPLRQAIFEKDKEKIQELNISADEINKVEEDDLTPFIRAVATGDKEIISLFLERGARASSEDAINDFLIATIKGDLQRVSEFIKNGIDGSVTGYGGYTALMHACTLGYQKIVAMLINAGCNVHTKNTIGRELIHIACGIKDTEIVKNLLSLGVNVNQQDNKGVTPLMIAVRVNSLEIVKLLLDIGANLHPINEGGSTALMIAAVGEQEAMVKFLLQEGANVNQGCDHPTNGRKGITPLLCAVELGLKELVRVLLEAKANVNQQDSNGLSPLIGAMRHQNNQIVNLLIQAGANVNQQDNKGWAPLMYASRLGLTEVVRILLGAGADLNLASNLGSTALSIAIANKQDEITKELVFRGADVNACYLDGKSGLMVAVGAKNEDAVKRWLEVGVDVNRPDSRGLTPLMVASQLGLTEVVKMLLDSGADNKFKGATALLAAVVNGRIDIVKELIKRNVDVNIKLPTGKAILMPAITHKNIEMVELLLDAKANVDQPDSMGMTSLMYAAELGHEDIVDLLLKYEADISIEGHKAITIAAKNGHMSIVTKLLELVSGERRKLLASIFDKALTSNSLELANRLLALHVSLAGQALPGHPNITPLRFLGEQEVELKMAGLFEDTEKIAELEATSKIRTELELLISFCRTSEIQDYLGKKPGIDNTVKFHLESDKYIRTDKYKQTVLMWAAMFGHNDAVKKILTTLVPLLLLGVDKEVRANNPKLDRAIRYINAQDVRGRTALMYAIVYGYNDIAQTLIPYCGSSINLKDKDGYTALGYAAQKGDKELIKILLKYGAGITTSAIKQVAEQNSEHLAVSLLGQKMGQNIFGTLT